MTKNNNLKLKNGALALLVGLLTFTMTGCSTFHSDYERPQISDYTFKYGHLSDEAKDPLLKYTKELKLRNDSTVKVSEEAFNKDQITTDLWIPFNDKKLEALVKLGLENNTDYRMALINVKKAMVSLDDANISLFPELNQYSIGDSISKNLKHGGSSSKNANSSLGLSYEVDLFGRVNAETKVKNFELEASEYDALTARLTLISSIAKVYWNIVFYADAVNLSEQNIKDSEENLKIMIERHESGNISEISLVEAKRDLIDMQTSLAENETELKKNITAMNILLSRAPNTPVDYEEGIYKLEIPKVKAGLSSDMLSLRPDMAAAESKLKAKLSQYDVERLGMYPKFTLSADIKAGHSDSLVKFFENPVGSIASMITFPFLNYYRQSLKIDLASLNKESEEITFVATYYKALGEVDDALKNIELTNLKLSNTEKNLLLNIKREELYLIQYNAGKVALKDYLEAKTQRRNSQLSLIKIKNEQLNNFMTLGKAMGGL